MDKELYRSGPGKPLSQKEHHTGEDEEEDDQYSHDAFLGDEPKNSKN